MDGAQVDPFGEVANFLVVTGLLDDANAKIYALGLRKFSITTADVIREFPEMRQTTAGDCLRRLSRLGYFENTPSDSKSKGKAKKFRSIAPRIALKRIMEQSSRLPESIAMIDEHFEHHMESANEEEEIWLVQSEKASFLKGASIIKSAKKSIKMFSNDCSWFNDDGIRSALEHLVKRNVSIIVKANPGQRESEGLKAIGVRIISVKEKGPPICIVDDRILLQVTMVGSVRTRYNLMTTSQPYTVRKHLELFESLGRRSESESEK